MAGKRLLVVEDDFLIRLTLTETLQDAGFEVLEASNTDEAALLLDHDDAIALLITDIQLPGSMDGRQLAAHARIRRPDLPVMFMTGRPEVGLAIDPLRDLLVAKPYLPSEICRAAARMVG